MDELLEQFFQNPRLLGDERTAFAVFRRFWHSRPAGVLRDGANPALSPGLLRCFLTEYLPRSLCRADEAAIDALYPVLERFGRFCTACGVPGPLAAMGSLPIGLWDEFSRPLRAKAALLRLIESPVLRREPLLIDLGAYARQRERNRKSRRIAERGLYQVADVFGRDSVVLRRLWREEGPATRSDYVRLYLNAEVVAALRPRDTLRLTLRERGFLSGWLVEDVAACYAGDMPGLTFAP